MKEHEMNTFNFEGGMTAEIKNIDGKVVVSVIDEDGYNIEISGFPSGKDAHTFVMFGDFENPDKDNDFIITTHPNYELKWRFDIDPGNPPTLGRGLLFHRR